MNNTKLIRISDETDKKLSAHGKFKDDYDSIISRILEQISKSKG
jgi:hypothetical protein